MSTAQSKHKLSNVLCLLAALLFANFFVAFSTEVYSSLGWNAPVTIALYSIGLSLVLAVIAVVLRFRSPMAWLVLVSVVLVLAAVVWFLANFKFKM